MQRPKVLSLALSAARFSVSDLVNLSELPENTVRDAVREMQERGFIERAGQRDGRTGRKSDLYAWVEGGRSAAAAELRTLVPGWQPSKPVRTEESDDGKDPFDESLQLTGSVLATLEERASPTSDKRLLQRIKAELAMLRNAVRHRSENDATIVSALSTKVERIARAFGNDILTEVVSRQSAPLVEAMRTLARSTGPLPAPERLDGGFGLILDVTRPNNEAPGLLDETIRRIGRPTVHLRFHGHEESVIDKALSELSTFLTAPASSIARVFLVVGSGASVGFAQRLVEKLLSPKRLEASFQRSQNLYWHSDDVEDRLLLEGSLPKAPGEWYVQGTVRTQAIRKAVTKTHDFDSLVWIGRAALNNPCVIYSTPRRAASKGPFGEFFQSSADDIAHLEGIVIAAFLSTAAAMERYHTVSAHEPTYTLHGPRPHEDVLSEWATHRSMMDEVFAPALPPALLNRYSD